MKIWYENDFHETLYALLWYAEVIQWWQWTERLTGEIFTADTLLCCVMAGKGTGVSNNTITPFQYAVSQYPQYQGRQSSGHKLTTAITKDINYTCTFPVWNVMKRLWLRGWPSIQVLFLVLRLKKCCKHTQEGSKEYFLSCCNLSISDTHTHTLCGVTLLQAKRVINT